MDPIRIDRIICPTDHSEFSGRALGHAIALTRWFGAELTVLRVVPDVLPTPGGPDLPVPVLTSPALRDEAADELAAFAEPAIAAGLPVRTLLRDGDPWREIVHEAEALPADLVVMGTHGRSGFEHLLLGSVTEKVLRRAPCPVMTVCREEGRSVRDPARYRRILCAVDLGPGSGHTVATASALADRSRASLTLLHAIEGLPEPGRHPYLAVPEVGALQEKLEATAREQLQRLVPRDLRDRVEVEERVAVGRAHRQVLRLAAEQPADLIVLGAYVHGAIEHLLFGSTSEHVVRAAGCPVLVTRPFRAAPASDPAAPQRH
jgi:nucleotide-binding universal stress UspA family protein